MISNALPITNSNNNTYEVVKNWHKSVFIPPHSIQSRALTDHVNPKRVIISFMGSDVFCLKLCDNDVTGSLEYCNNIFDETGCSFVSPASVSRIYLFLTLKWSVKIG